MTRGVIFDLDGVISDTQDMHSEVESNFLRSLNIHIHPNEISARFAGVGDKQMFATVFAEHGVHHSIDEMSKEKWARMSQMINEHGIKAVNHSIALIERLYASGFTLAIASGSPNAFIDQVVDALSIRKYFKSMVSADEVKHGKPSPDVFLEAAKRADIDTKQSLIVEDGVSGMRAAATAGIPCIGLVQNKDKEYPATVVVTSLADVSIDLIEQLIANKSFVN